MDEQKWKQYAAELERKVARLESELKRRKALDSGAQPAHSSDEAALQFYTNVLDASPQPIFIHAENRYLYANQTALRLAGAEAFEQMAARPVMDLFVQEECASVKSYFQDILAGKGAPRHETRIAHADGKEIPVEMTTSQIEYLGKPAIQVMLRDLSTNKLVEKVLKKSEERYRSLFDHMNEVVSINEILYDEQGQPCDWLILDVNPAYLRQTGRTKEEVVGRRLSTFESREASLPFLPRFEEVVRTQVPTQFETYFEPLQMHMLVSAFPFGGARFVTVALDISERVKAEAALRASESRLADFLNSTNDNFFALDRDWRFLYANRQFGRYVQRDPQDLIGKVFWEEFPSYLGTPAEPYYRKAMAERIPVRFESGGIYTPYWFEVSIYPSQDGITVFSMDRTETHLAEEALHLSEEKFSIAFANNPAAIALTRLEDGLFVDVNKTWEALVGFKHSEVIGQFSRKMDIWPCPEDAQRFVQALREQGSIHNWEQKFFNRSGKPFIAELSAQLLAVRGEQMILSTLVDITERKQAEERERLRAAQLEAVLKALPIGLAITDEQGGVLLQNEAYFQVWGSYQPPEAHSVDDYHVYRAWWMESGAEIKPEEWASAQAVQQGIPIIGQKLKLRRFDGKFTYVLNSASPIKDASGRVTGSAVAIQDITPLWEAEHALHEINSSLEKRIQERTYDLSIALIDLERAEDKLRSQNIELEANLIRQKSLQNQLIQSEKYAALARLIGSVAHEIQNPLQTVRNCIHLLRPELESPEAREVLDMAYEECNRMSELVQLLRETYRPPVKNESIFNLSEVLEKVHRLIEPQLKQNHVEWVQEISSEPVPIHGVADRIQQVFMNICLNAVDAINPRRGTIHVRVSKKGHRAFISVQDDGLGISEDIQERIFEPFFTTKEKGSGLGLAISFEIIKDHGGEIRVRSQPGIGATFTVELPLAETKG